MISTSCGIRVRGAGFGTRRGDPRTGTPRAWRQNLVCSGGMENARRETIKGVLFVNVATFAWATNISLGRYVRHEIGPFTLTATRYLVAAFAFWVLLRHAPSSQRRIGADLKPLAAMAVAGIVLFAPLLYFGLRFTSAVNGTLINGLGPLLTAVFAAWLIKEPYTLRRMIGAVAAVAGVVVLVSGAMRGASVNPGDLVIVAAVAMWGLYSVAGKVAMRNRSPLSATALSTLIGLPVLLVAAIVEQSFVPVVLSWRLEGIVVYLGLVPAALGFSLWNAGVKRLGPGGAMIFYNTLPLYGAILGVLLLGEQIAVTHAVGGLLIVGGGLYAASARRSQAGR